MAPLGSFGPASEKFVIPAVIAGTFFITGVDGNWIAGVQQFADRDKAVALLL